MSSSDASNIAQALEEVGFEVELKYDLNRYQMLNAVERLGHSGADTTLFYFSGYWMEDLRTSHFVPVEAAVGYSSALEREAVSLDYVVGAMSRTAGATRIVIADVVDVGGRISTTAALGMLRELTSQSRTIVTFSSRRGRSGDVADAGSSLYTPLLVEALSTPDLAIQMLLQDIEQRVQEKLSTEHWRNQAHIFTSKRAVKEPFYFVSNAENPSPPTPPPPPIWLPPGDGHPPYPPPPKPDFPKFPWQPPLASASVEVPRHFLVAGESTPTFGSVVSRLEGAFDQAGYTSYSYYSVPGGFAVASQLGRIEDDGSPHPEPTRWNPELQPLAFKDFSIRTYIKALSMSEPGVYRVVVFIVTAEPFSQSKDVVSKSTAIGWKSQGLNSLPRKLRARAYSDETETNALVYEFKQIAVGEPSTLSNPSAHSANTHLARSKIFSFSSEPK